MQVVSEGRPGRLNGAVVAMPERRGHAEVTVCAPAVQSSLEQPQAAVALSRHGAGTLDAELHGRRYQARWMHLGTVEHLRVNVRVEPAGSGEGKLHVETLDLYSPRSRRIFASRAAQVLGATVDGVESDLSDLLVAMDRAQREAARTASVAVVAEETPG